MNPGPGSGYTGYPKPGPGPGFIRVIKIHSGSGFFFSPVSQSYPVSAASAAATSIALSHSQERFYFIIVDYVVIGKKMQGAIQSFLSHGNIVKSAVLQRIRLVNPMLRPVVSSRFESVSSARMEEHGFESTTISDILKAKGKGADGSWLWCTTDDTVYDAVKSMTQHNVGALVVVKPGEQKSVAGIITERDNRIRHIPVIDDKGMIGMVSIGDVVRAVVSEHREELNRLNAFIQGVSSAIAYSDVYGN
ncbi:CBS domain-containing protein CBSX3 [Citrus sinensis]|uniref:CBS domain-containing protein CBSX3 n=1 Tax=Citrus sinensis TaxID=2711 RepID=A0ACB8JIH3_CITSI|nr:CBS domain-containing protein CBSX3 [Citrus sinensis]